MISFIHALILLFVIEGTLFALFPGMIRRAMLELITKPDASIRATGVIALLIAVISGVLLRYLG